MNDKPTSPVDTGGGTNITGDVNIDQGDFVARDKVTIGTVHINIAPPDSTAIANNLRFFTSCLPISTPHFVGREVELARLDEAWTDAKTPIITLVAFGGVGKSTLVAQWLEQLRQDDWRGAIRVFGYSFYSQGTREEAQASADSFVDIALRWFGDERPEFGSPWDKGQRLAHFVRQHKTLLVLDGVEPLQWGPTAGDAGMVKDPALAALIRELGAYNPGLCVITTRQRIADVPMMPVIDLEQLPPAAGAALLKQLGVQGTDVEMEDASEQVRGHGLALKLLGTYLQRACNGDVRRIGEIELATADQRQGGHARKLMEKYERWFGNSPELSILRLMGLFDRPTEVACIAKLREEPTIPGLTDTLIHLREEDWNWTVSTLRECGLIAENAAQTENSLDAHPLVREHFAAQLTAQLPDSAREAHRRLYEYLKKSTPYRPDTLSEIMPLYHAVAHGCKAELHEVAFRDVLLPRIYRGGNTMFSTRQLGAFGADLATLSNAFDKLWLHPYGHLHLDTQATVLNLAGFDLGALGRTDEAIEVMKAGLEIRIKQGTWQEAALDSPNLSELYLVSGDIANAVRVAVRGVMLADRSKNDYWRAILRTTLADALHRAGRPARAITIFREVEAIQAQWNRICPYLYSLHGFHYCDLLLSEAGDLPQIYKIRRRAETTLSWVTNNSGFGVLDRAVDHLTVGRTYLLEWSLKVKQNRHGIDPAIPKFARDFLEKSISLLRESRRQDLLPYGLLARAEMWRMCGEAALYSFIPFGQEDYFVLTQRDLREVEENTQRSKMLLWQIEATLQWCKLAVAMGDKAKAKGKLDEVRFLVKQTEKSYESYVPEWDKWIPPSYINAIRPGEIVGYSRRNAEIVALERALI